MAIKARATQDFVPIREIRDGIVVLRNGGLRAILMASSINFALKSEDNQKAIILQFQNFLNTLDFSLQIVVESRRFNVAPYLALLEERRRKQQNELLKVQTRDYISFVKGFTDNANIMSKTFFIVVPYTPSIVELRGRSEGIGANLRKGFGGGKKREARRAESFEEHRNQLMQRVGIVEQGLSRTGVRMALLGTDEVVELFYQLFNPGETEKPASMG